MTLMPSSIWRASPSPINAGPPSSIRMSGGDRDAMPKLQQSGYQMSANQAGTTSKQDEVEIDKLHALRYADSVSMTMSWRR
jgi:hypothetical protein